MKKVIQHFTSGVIWKDDSICFNPNTKIDNSEIIAEYLNDISIEEIEKDIKKLQSLEASIEKLNQKELETHLMNEFDGYTEYEDGYYVFVAGAHDLSPSVLFDIQNNDVFLIHPNFSSTKKFFISPNDLISLIKFKKTLIKLIN